MAGKNKSEVTCRDYFQPFFRTIKTVPKLILFVIVGVVILIGTYLAVLISNEIHAQGDPWLINTTKNIVGGPMAREYLTNGLRLASQHPLGFFILSTVGLVAFIATISAVQVAWAIEHGKIHLGDAPERANGKSAGALEPSGLPSAMAKHMLTAPVQELEPRPNVIWKSYKGGLIVQAPNDNWTISEIQLADSYNAILAVFGNDPRPLTEPRVGVADTVRARIKYEDSFGLKLEIDPATWIDSLSPTSMDVGEQRELILGYVTLTRFVDGAKEEPSLRSVADRRQFTNVFPFQESRPLRGTIIVTVEMTVDGIALKPEKVELTLSDDERTPPKIKRLTA